MRMHLFLGPMFILFWHFHGCAPLTVAYVCHYRDASAVHQKLPSLLFQEPFISFTGNKSLSKTRVRRKVGLAFLQLTITPFGINELHVSNVTSSSCALVWIPAGCWSHFLWKCFHVNMWPCKPGFLWSLIVKRNVKMLLAVKVDCCCQSDPSVKGYAALNRIFESKFLSVYITVRHVKPNMSSSVLE